MRYELMHLPDENGHAVYGVLDHDPNSGQGWTDPCVLVKVTWGHAYNYNDAYNVANEIVAALNAYEA